MDFVRLGPLGNTDYVPDGVVIEGYSSLIWTERQQELGEFELKTTDIQRMRELLPIGVFVSHLETLEVMRVDTHSIEEVGDGADAYEELTITGKAAWDILNHRWVESSYQKKRRMRKAYTATTAICVLLYNAVDNNSGYDVTRGDTLKGTADGNNYAWTTLDDIPNVVVTEQVASEGTSKTRYLEQGPLMPQLQTLMAEQELGLRCLRPVTPNTVTVVTVASSLSIRGTVYRTPTQDVTGMQFQVYDGVDRSSTVQMSLLQGHILSPEYLTSDADFESVVEVMSGTFEVADVYRPGENTLSGWNRKTISIDAGTPELDARPTRPRRPKWSTATSAQKRAYYNAYDAWLDKDDAWSTKRAADIADFRAEAKNTALTLLKAHNKTNMFAGDISDLSPFKYKKDYDLGDTITLVGNHGISSKMIVREYVRTEDENGDRGFPGLVAP